MDSSLQEELRPVASLICVMLNNENLKELIYKKMKYSS